MRVFVLGSSGMLGCYVYKYLNQEGYNVVSVNRDRLDAFIPNYYDVKQLGIVQGDVVINCMGLIPHRTNTTKAQFLLVNSVFPRVVADVCAEVGVDFIQVTTDCVFTGAEGGYVESSPHTAMDIYGRSKSLGEPENATIIRTSIIGEELSNKLSLVEWVKSQAGKSVNGYLNHFWNGMTCLQFAKICDYMLKNDLFWKGVKHIHSPNKISKFGLILAISNIYELGVEVKEFKTPEKCDRSLKSERTDVLIEVPGLYDQIKEMKEFKI